MTDLRFIGDWRLWGGLVVGLALAVAAWLLYWRETRARAGAVRWVLPTLRALAVLLLVLMLTGPVLHHRNIIGEVARILLFVDASASMSITDQEMELPRKLFVAQQLGWLATNKFDPDLRAAASALANAQETAARAKPNLPAPHSTTSCAALQRTRRTRRSHSARSAPLRGHKPAQVSPS